MHYLIPFLCFTLICISAHAERAFQKIAIPGAVCGNGAPYHVYVDLRSKTKLVVEFMGGGACWNYASCEGILNQGLTFLYERSPLKMDIMPSDDLSMSPFAHYTMIYFPYCTGDVHSGQHQATYASSIDRGSAIVEHKGYRNVQRSIQALIAKGLLHFNTLNTFVLAGSSAGAIGALVHTATFRPYLRPTTKKIIIADAPGLHYGNDFWKKFSPEMVRDFHSAFGAIGANFDEDDGNIIQFLPSIAATIPDWRMGILQGSRDMAMSTLFGNISPRDEEELIYGDKGLIRLCEAIDRCSSWVPTSYRHTFLKKMKYKSVISQGKSAYDFINDLLSE